MRDGDVEAEQADQVRISGKQMAFVDHYMSNGFDKKKAFYAAGFHAANPDRLPVRIRKLFDSEAVQAEIRKRQAVNAVQLHRYVPLDVMCANLDFWFSRALDATLTEAEQWMARDKAQDIAVAAAPYVHPRLQAIAHTHQIKRSIDDFSDEELKVLEQSSDRLDGTQGSGAEGGGPE